MAYTGPTQIFINNKFVDSVSGKKFGTVNPGNGKEIAQVSEGDKADIDAAVMAADTAFVKWRKSTGDTRGRLLLALASLVEENLDLLAATESLDNGMNITMAKGSLSVLPSWIRHYAGYADKLHGSTIPLPNPTQMSYTLLEPIGVVGAIVPWNFPLNLTIWKLAPALACGNTIVIKPSEKTPLSILRLAELIVKAGFPPGVVNIVPGYGSTAGDALSRHMRVRKITFTGSVITGRAVLKAAADSNLKRVTLELGGKSPIIVCDDCDLDEAAFYAYQGIFLHQGQFCAAGSRVFVQDTIYDKFVARAKELAKERLEQIGDPQNEVDLQQTQFCR
jgi:aldehyde dehydrogenase (NAD+)